MKTEGPELGSRGRNEAGGLRRSLEDCGMVGVMMAQSSDVGGRRGDGTFCVEDAE